MAGVPYTKSARLMHSRTRWAASNSWSKFNAHAWSILYARQHPAFTRDYPEGAKIEFVTGSCAVTLTDGATTETYPNIVSGYDMLVAIRDHSLLALIEGVVSDDPTPDNLLAAIDLRTRTTALLLWNKGSGSKYATGFDPCEVFSQANTEIITAECVAATSQENAGVGRERWSVKGSVSGDLGVLATGETIALAEEFSMTIPPRLPPGWNTPRGRLSSKVSLASRTGTELPAIICVDRLRTGPNAKDGSYTFTYKKRPTDECNCNDQEYKKLPSSNCLGVADPNTGGTSDMKPEVQSRLVALTEWLRGFSMLNTESKEGPIGGGAGRINYTGDYSDLTAAKEVSQLLSRTLEQIGESPSALAVWDQCFTQVQTDLSPLGSPPAMGVNDVARFFGYFAPGTATPPAGITYRSNVWPVGFLIKLKGNKWLQGYEPNWNLLKRYKVHHAYWKPNTHVTEFGVDYAGNYFVEPGNGRRYLAQITGDGISGANEPDWDSITGDDFTQDGNAGWKWYGIGILYDFWKPMSIVDPVFKTAV
ncbi:hypothetical protein CCP4SC76_330002 [Gammaproteobacteria bacterium]